jgi:hypothetical protein
MIGISAFFGTRTMRRRSHEKTVKHSKSTLYQRKRSDEMRKNA